MVPCIAFPDIPFLTLASFELWPQKWGRFFVYAVHVRQLGGGSPLHNPMEVK